MTLYYINGTRTGGSGSLGGGQYGAGRQQFRRLMWVWLTKILGWTHVDDESGDPDLAWDHPTIGGSSGIADGATDVTDSQKFTSATGGFSALSGSIRYYLLIKGFSDPTKDGFYLIDRSISDNELRIRKVFSLHTDGLPLGESNLTFWVYDFYSQSTRPGVIGNSTWWVLAGTGIGGTFHLRCQNNTTYAYMRDQFDLSPYDDWDSGTHNWKAPARYTAIQGDMAEPYSNELLVFGVADSDKHNAVFWTRTYNDSLNGVSYPTIYYFGDIVPLRPTDDLRPVVCVAKLCDSNWQFNAHTNIGQIAWDYSQVNARAIHASQYADKGAGVLDSSYQKVRSYFSGRLFQLPWVVATETSGKVEVRGYLKYLLNTHAYGDRAGTPFGAFRDQIRFANISIPFNGSRQYQYIY